MAKKPLIIDKFTSAGLIFALMRICLLSVVFFNCTYRLAYLANVSRENALN